MILGCTPGAAEPELCQEILDWVTIGSPSSWPHSGQARWLLAHCDDGVVWGYRDSADTWRLSSGLVFPSLQKSASPTLRHESLQQVRLFGDEGELLVWRDEVSLRGRWLHDSGIDSLEEHQRPIDEYYLLLGDRMLDDSMDGFTLVGDAAGSRHSVPVECSAGDFDLRYRGRGDPPPWPLQLHVRHYLEQDERSGTVRIAASRLVRVLNRRR
jgi:CRISPR-associated protein (TIGR03984 family)